MTNTTAPPKTVAPKANSVNRFGRYGRIRPGLLHVPDLTSLASGAPCSDTISVDQPRNHADPSAPLNGESPDDAWSFRSRRPKVGMVPRSG
jgi:hypothetical protein